jgi:hypothetical protein
VSCCAWRAARRREPIATRRGFGSNGIGRMMLTRYSMGCERTRRLPCLVSRGRGAREDARASAWKKHGAEDGREWHPDRGPRLGTSSACTTKSSGATPVPRGGRRR